MLYNTATNRWHPIVFDYYPGPGDTTERQRLKSAGHHTAGFATEQQAWDAINEIAEQHGFSVKSVTYQWDGKDIPSMVAWLINGELVG